MSDRIRVQKNKKNKKPDKKELLAIIKKKWKLFALAAIVVALLIGSIIVLVLQNRNDDSVDLGNFQAYSMQDLQKSEFFKYFPDLTSEGYTLLETTGIYYGNTFHSEQVSDNNKVTTTIMEKSNLDYQENLLDLENVDGSLNSPVIESNNFGDKYYTTILELASNHQESDDYLIEFSLVDEKNHVTYTIQSNDKSTSEQLFSKVVEQINK